MYLVLELVEGKDLAQMEQAALGFDVVTQHALFRGIFGAI